MSSPSPEYRLSHTSPPSRLTQTWHRVGVVIPSSWRTGIRRRGQYLHARQLKANDALLLSYPKSGSSWLRNMFAAIRAEEPIDPSTLADWIPPHHYLNGAKNALVSGYEGRIVRSHDSVATPGFGRVHRVVVLVRDPRAVAVSMYFHRVRRGVTDSSITNEAQELVSAAGSAGLGSWQSHVSHALKAPKDSVSVFRYEDLVESPQETLSSICEFLGWRVNDQIIQMAVEHTRPEVLRRKRVEAGMDDSNDPIGGIRRAEADSWREECPDEAKQLIWAAAKDQMLELGYTQA